MHVGEKDTVLRLERWTIIEELYRNVKGPTPPNTPERTTSTAFLAMLSQLQNHCGTERGSIMSPLRLHFGTTMGLSVCPR